MKKQTTVIFNSLVLASTLLLTACNGDNETSNVAELSQYTQQAQTYLDQSQFKAAINSANNAVLLYPDHLDGYMLLAKTFNKLGQSSQAIDTLIKYKGVKDSNYYLLLLESYQRSKKAISANRLIAEHSDLLSENENEFKLLQAKLFLLENNQISALASFKELQNVANFESEGFIGEARIAAANNEKENALVLLDKAIQTNDKNVEALILKGFLLMEKGDIEKAEKTLSFALTVVPSSDIFTPERINILKALTSILTSQGRSSEALLYSRILSDEFPTATTVNEYYASAQQYYKRKQTDLAKAELYKILKVDAHNKKASTMLGVILYTEGDINGAEKYLSGMIDPETNAPQLTQIYAMTQLKLNQSNDVLAILDNVIDYEKRLDTLTLYTIAAISEKQFDKADVSMKRIEELFPNSSKLAILKSSYISAKSPEDNSQILAVLEQGLSEHGADLSLQTAYLKKLIELKELNKADEFVEKQASEESNAIGTRLLIANYYLYRKQFIAAEQHFNDMLNVSDDNIQAYFGLAQSKQLQLKWDDAFKEYAQIIDLYPEELRAYYGAVISLQQQDKDPLNVASYLSSKHNPDVLALVLADYQYQNKQFIEADKLIKVAVNLPVELKDKAEKLQEQISNERIIAAIRAKNYSIARDLVLAQLQLTPTQPLFLMRLATIETLSGQYAEADKVLKQIESMLPDSYQVVLLKSQLAFAQKNVEKAEQLLRVEWDKNAQEEVAVELYKLYKERDADKAHTFLEAWLSKAPASVYANLNDAMYLQAKGNNNEAILAYEKVLAIVPNELRSLNNTAWLHLLNNDPKAEEFASRAYKVAPNNAAVLDTYGWILFKNGKVAEAKPLIEKALELSPDDVEIQKHWSELSK